MRCEKFGVKEQRIFIFIDDHRQKVPQNSKRNVVRVIFFLSYCYLHMLHFFSAERDIFFMSLVNCHIKKKAASPPPLVVIFPVLIETL